VVAGLDIGTHQVTAAVGRLGASQALEVIALRAGPTHGLSHGVIVDLADCVEAVARVVRAAEEQAGARVMTVAATIHGPLIQRHTVRASITLPDASSEMSRGDVGRVLAACRTAASSYDRQLLHEFVQRFTVDDQQGVRDPIGLFGGRLEVELHVVTVPTGMLQSWRKVLNHAGMEVRALVLPGVATSHAVLSDLDRDLGVIVVDVGGAHTDIICWVDGAVRETLAVPWGGDRLTEQIAERFELPLAAAEQLKLQCNSIEASAAHDGQLRVQVGRGTRMAPRAEVAALLATGTQALFTAVRQRLETSRYFREASAGLVVTGGTALMEGVLELAETICNLPVRLGSLHGIACHPRLTVTPASSTAIGLLAYPPVVTRPVRIPVAVDAARPWGRLVQRARTLLEDYF